MCLIIDRSESKFIAVPMNSDCSQSVFIAIMCDHWSCESYESSLAMITDHRCLEFIAIMYDEWCSWSHGHCSYIVFHVIECYKMISVHLMTVYDTYETNKQNSCEKLDSTLCECEVILLQNATQSRLLEVFYSSRSPCSLPNWRLSNAYSVPRLGSQERGEEENK